MRLGPKEIAVAAVLALAGADCANDADTNCDVICKNVGSAARIALATEINQSDIGHADSWLMAGATYADQKERECRERLGCPAVRATLTATASPEVEFTDSGLGTEM